MTDNQPTEAMVENIAISIHYADGDPATVKWAKQSGKYRASLRRNVRDVLAAVDRLGVRFPPSPLQSPDKERGETPAPADQKLEPHPDAIERVAKAIYEADDVWSAAFPWPTMGSNEQSADNYRRIARAALDTALKSEGSADANS